jgi:DNA-binding MarR family transcriptional regulator
MGGSYFATLTPQQALVLDALRTVGTMTLAELRVLTGLGQTYLRRAHHELVALELLTSDYTRGKGRPMTLTVTRTGCRVLARHKREVGRKSDRADLQMVPPRSYDIDVTTYKPAAYAYYRNEGNKHIASVGVGC